MNQPDYPAPAESPQGPAATPPPLPAGSVQADPRMKSPVIAGALSLMPGLGQIYVGYYQRGFFNAIVFASLVALLATDQLGDLTPLAAIFMAFFHLYNMIDAARKAALYNQALVGGAEIDLPSELPTQGGGSMVGGAAMLVAGAVLLLHTRFDMSLEWLEEWWPAGLILFGAYLVFRAVQDRSTDSPDSDEH